MRRAQKLFLVADNLKTQSDRLMRRADELKQAMRVSQGKLRDLRKTGVMEPVVTTTLA